MTNPPSASPSALYVNKLNDEDVLLGRGTGPNGPKGNIIFRQFVHAQRQTYLEAKTPQEQRDVFQNTIALVYANGGKFVKKAGSYKTTQVVAEDAVSSASTTTKKKRKKKMIYFEIVSDVQILMDKTKQAFRYLKGLDTTNGSIRSTEGLPKTSHRIKEDEQRRELAFSRKKHEKNCPKNMKKAIMTKRTTAMKTADKEPERVGAEKHAAAATATAGVQQNRMMGLAAAAGVTSAASSLLSPLCSSPTSSPSAHAATQYKAFSSPLVLSAPSDPTAHSSNKSNSNASALPFQQAPAPATMSPFLPSSLVLDSSILSNGLARLQQTEEELLRYHAWLQLRQRQDFQLLSGTAVPTSLPQTSSQHRDEVSRQMLIASLLAVADGTASLSAVQATTNYGIPLTPRGRTTNQHQYGHSK